MSMDNVDLQSLGHPSQESANPPRPRGWWSRNWLWFVPSVLFAFLLICCGCLTGMVYFGLGAMFQLDVFKEAMTRIQADEGVRRELGEPITHLRWPLPAGNMEQTNGSGEADFLWGIAGPKGQARAHLKGRLTNNRWEIVLLEVTLSNGKKLSLTGEAGGDNDAPVFQGTKTDAAQPAETGPPPDIKLPTFDEPPGAQK